MTDYHGPQSIKELCDWAKNRCHRDQNANILVVGEPGTGKTSLVLQMASYIWPAFDPSKHIPLTVSELNGLVKRLPRGAVLSNDEAVLSGGNKRRAMEKGNKDNLDRLATDRKRNLVRFDIMPHLGESDRVLQTYAHWLLDVKTLGRVTVYEPYKFGFKGQTVNWMARFEEDFPDCQKVRPDLWEPYYARIFGRLNENDALSLDRIERRKRFQSIIRQHLARVQ